MNNTTLATIPPDTNQHADFRSKLMTLPVEKMTEILTEYEARRKAFRVWLLSQMTQGVHYGFPPGCLPDKRIPPEQWTARPSLYEAGADLLIDLLMFRPEYESDVGLWTQMGSLPGRFFIKCKLFDKATGEMKGEGVGASQAEPEKNTRNGHPVNFALKIGKKRAKVDAVKNALGVSDLFTQDLEDDDAGSPPKPPQAKPDSAKAQPRDERVTADELKSLFERIRQSWQGITKEELATVCRQNGGAVTDPLKPSSWNREQLAAIDNYLKNVRGC